MSGPYDRDIDAYTKASLSADINDEIKRSQPKYWKERLIITGLCSGLLNGLTQT